MSINVLVTGANGQLGKTIEELFLGNEDSINFVFTSKKKLDISNKNQLEEVFHKNKFHYCINCAAYTNVEEAEVNPDLAFKINAEGAKNIALVCKKTNTVLIHISTDYVFDGKKEEPYVEEDKTNPINQYGRSKLLGEKFIKEALDRCFIIRTSWLYSKDGHNFVRTIINKLSSDTILEITTSQKGTPTSCIDLSGFIFFLIKNNINKFGTYHFTAQGEATWFDFAKQVSRSFKFNKIVPISNYSSKAKRPVYSVLNNTKAIAIYPKINKWQDSVDGVVKQLGKFN